MTDALMLVMYLSTDQKGEAMSPTHPPQSTILTQDHKSQA
jgi:hypothetical protein